jgi:outer membrane protein assembly factor BamB/photosystem II stability/assembly factor-like uncharacterized protein/uncharacterized protein YjdB
MIAANSRNMKKLIRTKFFGVLLLLCGLGYGNALSQTISISIPDTTVDAGETITIPVSVSEILESDNIFSGEWEFTSSSNLITFQDVSTSGTILDGINSTFNSSSGNFAFAAMQPVMGEGLFLNLTVQVREDAVKFEDSEIGITDGRFNEGEPPLVSDSGIISVRGIDVTPKQPSGALIEGQSFQFSVNGNITEPVTWTSSDTNIATVSSTGLVEGLIPGTVKIYVEDAAGLTDSTDFFRVEPISLQELTLGVSDRNVTQTLVDSVQVNVSDLTGLNITSGQFDMSFTSSKLEILSISTEGTILEGKTDPTYFLDGNLMRIAFADSEPYEGDGALMNIVFRVNRDATGTASFIPQNVLFNEDYEADANEGTVTIENAPEIIVNQPQDELTIGEGQIYSVESGGTAPYRWNTDDESVAVINENTGELQALSRGTVNITAVDSDNFESEPIELRVNDVTVSVADTSVQDYQTFTLPIETSDLTDLGIVAYEIDLDFDPALLNFESIESAGTISDGLNISNSVEEGVVKVAVAGTSVLSGEGTLLNVNFSIQDTVSFGSSGVVDPVRVQFNEPGPDTPTASRRSATISFSDSVLPDQVTLTAPENGQTGVPLNPEFVWGNSEGADEYELEIYSDPELTELFTTINGLTESTYLLPEDLNELSVYYWRVRAIGTEGAGPWSETWNFETVPGVAAAPVLMEPTDQEVNVPINPTLRWMSSTYAESYVVELTTDPNFEIIDLTESVTDTLFQADNLQFETVYYWRVKGVNELGEGDASGINSFTTEPELTEPDDAIITFSDLTVSTNTLFTGNTVVVNAIVENSGTNSGEFEASLIVNGEIVDSDTGLLDASTDEQIEFYYQINEPGSYQIAIEDLPEETIDVQPGWTQFNFGSNNNSTANFLRAPETEELRVKWQDIVSSTVSSSPIVVGGVVYFGALNGNVYAADTETGEIIWENETGAGIRSTPLIKGDNLFIGNQNGELFSINVQTGETEWTAPLGTAIKGSATYAGDVLYLIVDDGTSDAIYGVNSESGSTIWSYTFGSNISSFSHDRSTPSVADGVLYVGSYDSNLYAFNIADDINTPQDRILWSYDAGGSIIRSPSLLDGSVYIIRQGVLFSIDAETGAENWVREFDVNILTNAVVANGKVFVGTGSDNNGAIFAVNAETGDDVWSYRPSASYYFSLSGPTIADGKLFIGTISTISSFRRLYGFDIETGEVIYQYSNLPGYVRGAPVVIDGSIYLATQSAGVISFRETIPEDFIPDPIASEVSASSPHWADGTDQAQVDLQLVNESGEPITGLVNEDFQITAGNATLSGTVSEQFSAGSYRFNLQNIVSEIVQVQVEINGVILDDKPEVEFRAAESNWENLSDALQFNFDITNVGSIHFENETDGWIIGYVDDSSNPYLILNTTDAGESWSQQLSVDGGLGDIFFIDEQKGWAAGGNPDGGLIFYTEDGGENWTQQLSGEPGYFGSIFFIDENTGWAAGRSDWEATENVVYRTTNGGVSWEQSTLPTNVSVSDLVFWDENIGWATSNDSPGLFRTTDGGVTWTAGGEVSGISDISFIDQNRGWAVGNSGMILYTEDSGDTWSVQESGVSVQLNSVSFVDENTGWAFGERRTIIFTEDGGQSWEIEYPDTEGRFTRFQDSYFVNRNIGFTGGSNSNFVRYSTTEVAPEPIVDANNSTVTATTPHDADGTDPSTVVVQLSDSLGNPIERFSPADLQIDVSGSAEFTGADNTGNPGEFAFTVTNTVAETVSVSITVDDVQLADQPEILFEEPIQLVDADLSTVTATTPHLADGTDPSTVVVQLADSLGNPIERFSPADLQIDVSGSAEFTGADNTGNPGEFAFTVTNTVAETATVSITVDEVQLTDQPEIVFEEPIQLVDADLSTVTATTPHLADGTDPSTVSFNSLTHWVIR